MTKAKTEKYNEARVTIDGSLEHRLKRDNTLKQLATYLTAAAFGFNFAASALEASKKPIAEITSKAMIYTGLGLLFVAIALIVATSEPFELDGESTHNIELILKDLYSKQTNEDFNRELVKLAPVFNSMLKVLAERSPEPSKDILESVNPEKTANIIREYLKTHPKDAGKFVNILVAADIPQKLIDRYISEFMPTTITFDMARSAGY